MKITIICPVRKGTPREVYDYVAKLEAEGHEVYLPPRDTPQSDPTGFEICGRMRQAILNADEVHIWHSDNSQGCHFDLGMAFMQLSPLKLINNPDDIPPKSYLKVIKEVENLTLIDTKETKGGK